MLSNAGLRRCQGTATLYPPLHRRCTRSTKEGQSRLLRYRSWSSKDYPELKRLERASSP